MPIRRVNPGPGGEPTPQPFGAGSFVVVPFKKFFKQEVINGIFKLSETISLVESTPNLGYPREIINFQIPVAALLSGPGGLAGTEAEVELEMILSILSGNQKLFSLFTKKNVRVEKKGSVFLYNENFNGSPPIALSYPGGHQLELGMELIVLGSKSVNIQEITGYFSGQISSNGEGTSVSTIQVPGNINYKFLGS
jgi:hypothetical protein